MIGARNTALSAFICLGSALLAHSPVAFAQQANSLRPSLDIDETSNTNSPEKIPAAPARQTNAPLPIELQSTQPPLPPEPPAVPRRQPESNPFQPLGITAAGFRLFPILEVTGDYSDNVRSDSIGKINDVGLRVAPSLRLQSEWARHSLTFNAASDHIFYKDASEINSNALATEASLRLDIRHQTSLLNTISYEFSDTSNGSSEFPTNAIGNRREHELSFTSALSHRFNRLVATMTGGVNWLMFEDIDLFGGFKEDNADREYFEPSARLRLGYEISPNLTPYGEIGYNPRIHKKKRDRNGFLRDSQGITASAGIGFNLSPIWDGDIALTYEHRDFKDSRLQDINSIGMNARINWHPTQLTTISLLTSTSIDESVIPNISGAQSYEFALDISHRFRDNITGNFNLAINYDDFVGTSISDTYFTAQTGIAYAIRRELQWITSYQISYFKSGIPGNSYAENRISTGVRFRM